MDKITVNIVNVIGDFYGVEAEDGQKVHDKIKKAFAENKKVNLSFQNIDFLTTAFLNTAIGQLYKDNSEEYIKKNLTVSDISESGKISLKRVVDTAKLYYKDPDALKRSIDEILDN